MKLLDFEPYIIDIILDYLSINEKVTFAAVNKHLYQISVNNNLYLIRYNEIARKTIIKKIINNYNELLAEIYVRQQYAIKSKTKKYFSPYNSPPHDINNLKQLEQFEVFWLNNLSMFVDDIVSTLILGPFTICSL